MNNSTNQDWKIDWAIFVRSVTTDYSRGLGDTDISKKYGGHSVRWAGRIGEVRLNDKYAPGIRMVMPTVRIELETGHYVEADHLFLNTDNSTKSTWSGARPGVSVEFETRLIERNGPFGGVTLETFPNSKLVSLMVGTSQSRRIEA